MPTPIPLIVSDVTLGPTPLTSLQDVANEMVRQLKTGVFMPTGYAFIPGGPKPTSDVGPWRPAGSSVLWWWDPAFADYFPEGDTPGTIKMLAHDAAPEGWHFCQGQVVSQVEYPRLYAVLGQTWAISDAEAETLEAADQFRFPDFRSRFPVGSGQGQDLSDASLLTNRETGKRAGKEKRVLAMDELPNPLPAHCFEYASAEERPTARLYGGIHYDDTHPYDADIQGAAGTPAAQGNLPPLAAVQFIIRA